MKKKDHNGLNPQGATVTLTNSELRSSIGSHTKHNGCRATSYTGETFGEGRVDGLEVTFLPNQNLLKRHYNHCKGSLWWLHKNGGVAWWAASFLLGASTDDDVVARTNHKIYGKRLSTKATVSTMTKLRESGWKYAEIMLELNYPSTENPASTPSRWFNGENRAPEELLRLLELTPPCLRQKAA